MRDADFLAKQVAEAEEHRARKRDVIGRCDLCGLIDHHIQKGVGACCRNKVKDEDESKP